MLSAALKAGQHVLLEGPHGVGKSRLLAEHCDSVGSSPVVVHGSAGLTPAGLIGGHDPAAILHHGYRPDSFLPGPLVEAMKGGRVLVLDEANRVPADVINTLITSMSEGELYVPRFGRVSAATGFRVVASINPCDDIGTSLLPAAFLDRVVRLCLSYQDAEEELAIVRFQTPDADPRLRSKALFAARASRRHPDLVLGASVRGAVDLVLIATQLEDLGAVDPGLDAAFLALSSKIKLRPGVERSVEAIIRDLWSDAVIAEHRAARSPGAAAGGHPLPESSIQMDREPTEESELAAAPTPGQDQKGASPAGDPLTGSGGAGASPSGARGKPAADESTVVLETQSALTSFVKSSASRTGGRRLSQAEGEQEQEPDVERIAASIIVRRTQGRLPVASRQGGRFATVRYNFRSDDLDIDRTVGDLLETPVPTHAQLWVHDRVPKRRGIVLMLDVSGSMRGSRAIESATAAAAAALATEQDELSVIAFGTEAEVVKDSTEQLRPAELVQRVLTLRPQGLTNLSSGLQAGRAQLSQMRAPAKLAIVMTDGVQNEGPDALLDAARFPMLNVLSTTDSVWRLRHCRALATAGRGRCLGYESLEHLPGVLSTLLTR